MNQVKKSDAFDIDSTGLSTELKSNREIAKTNFKHRPHSSGFKTFLNWFKKVEKLQNNNEPENSKEVLDTESISSDSSTATVASFAFLDPDFYKPYGDALQPEKYIAAGPYTETYNRLISDRNHRRKLDMNMCLSKKYHLYTSGTINRNNDSLEAEKSDFREYNTLSLPSKSYSVKGHRRTFSESSTFIRPKSFVHVKGKRKAPPPPISNTNSINRTLRKKRPAPAPPTGEHDMNVNAKLNINNIPNKEEKMKESTKDSSVDTICDLQQKNDISYMSPKPWYKRQFSDNKLQKSKKCTYNENDDNRQRELPEVGFFRCSKFFEHKKNIFFEKNTEMNEKKIKRLSMLPNISELDREATEIIKMKRNCAEECTTSTNITESIKESIHPMCARELIRKFNKMSNVKIESKTNIENNQNSLSDKYLEHATEETDKIVVTSKREESCKANPLKTNGKGSNNGLYPKTWQCSKCCIENQYFRLSCSSCRSVRLLNKLEYCKVISAEENANKNLLRIPKINSVTSNKDSEVILNSAVTLNENQVMNSSAFDEKQKLKELLKEMKNSLPKRSKAINIEQDPCLQSKQVSEEQPVNSGVIVETNNTFAIKNQPSKHHKIDKSNENNYNAKRRIKKRNEEQVTYETRISIDSTQKISASVQTNAVLRKTEIANSSDLFDKKSDTKNSTTYCNLNEIQKVLSTGTDDDANLKKNAKDLYRKLEKAIASGDDESAAEFAKILAQLKVNCIVFGPTATTKPENSISVDIYVEDQESHQGPISLRIRRNMSIRELKIVACRELNIPIEVQRWIVGKQLADDDTKSISFFNDDHFDEPLFLYVVAKGIRPEGESGNIITNKVESSKKSSNIENATISAFTTEKHPRKGSKTKQTKESACSSKSHYQELMSLDNQDLVQNIHNFECSICIAECLPGGGVVLRDCLHTFCKECLANTIKFCEEAEVKCPYIDNQYSCESVLQEREIKSLVEKNTFEQHLAKSVSVAENKIENTFHCKTPDCKGWCIYEDYVNEFKCPVCKKLNCLTCQAIHQGLNCKQYQDKIKVIDCLDASGGLQTQQMLDEMLSKGEAMVCPSCQIVLMKKWGCDWLRCSMCKTEICWVTRGPRWGPNGKGDLNGGCQCGINGIKCHPKCNYCH